MLKFNAHCTIIYSSQGMEMAYMYVHEQADRKS